MDRVMLLELTDRELAFFVILPKGLMACALVLTSLLQGTLSRSARGRNPEGGVEMGESIGVLEPVRLTVVVRLRQRDMS